MKPVLVTCYVNPDLDGVASAIAYGEFLQKIGKHVVVGMIGVLHDEVRYILDRFGITYPHTISSADNFDEVILVDASDLNGLEGRIAPEKVVEIIDHRRIHEADKFPRARTQIEFVGSAATLIAEKFLRDGLNISQESAILLVGAIISNTLNFKGSVTTERDKEAVAWLNQVAKLPEDFWKDLFIAKSDVSGEKLAERIRNEFARFALGGTKIGIAQIEMIGAKKLCDERSGEITRILDQMKQEMSLDHVFQSIIELEDAKNYFIAHDVETQELLEKILDIRFFGAVAERSGLIMRKQIVPLLKQELES